jgi:hypothetical protein
LYQKKKDFFDPNAHPEPGNLSFCLMCTEASVWDNKMKLIKFDLNSIEDLVERVRIKRLKTEMELFWEQNPDPRRDRYVDKVR